MYFNLLMIFAVAAMNLMLLVGAALMIGERVDRYNSAQRSTMKRTISDRAIEYGDGRIVS